MREKQSPAALAAENERLRTALDLIRSSAESALQPLKDRIPDELLPALQLSAARERIATLERLLILAYALLDDNIPDLGGDVLAEIEALELEPKERESL